MWNQLILVLASLIFIYGQNTSVSFTMESTTIDKFSTVSLTSSTTQSYSSTKTTNSMAPSLTTFSNRETTTVSHASTTSEDKISTKTTTTSITSTQVTITTVGFHETSTYNNSRETKSDTIAPNNNQLDIILPAVLVPLLVLIAAAIVILVLYFRHSRITGGGSSNKISKVIDILDFENNLADMNANSQLKFSEEFMELSSVGKEYSKDVAGMEVNREKNRYTDIKPYDVSRVKLSINPEDESDYINASWIPGYFSRRQYIAAQGPMPSTQDDFWRMVWEYNSRIIIMLTKTVENNRIKCCQYWPSEKEVIMYGDIAVSIIDETETDSWIIREMNVSMGQQKRLVKHCFYMKWPDMKAPEESSSIIDFIRMIRGYSPMRGSSPLVVHCSAGVGRTGAYIALDTAMYQIEEEKKVDIFGVVYKMRLNRVSMVQNERQYVFIYETVADIIRSYLQEKKNSNGLTGLGQNEFFFGDLPKNDSIGDHVVYQNLNASGSALTINDDIKTLL